MTSKPDVNVETRLEEQDISLGRKLASGRNHPAVRRLASIGKLGDQEPLYAMGYAALFIGLVQKRRILVEASISALVAVAIADLGKQAIKNALKRTRPEELLDKGNYGLEAGGSEEKKDQSFPSGHVACTFAAGVAVSTVYPPAIAPSLAATIIVGVSRLVKGKHWPLDVAAGLIVGALAAVTACAAVKATSGELPRAI